MRGNSAENARAHTTPATAPMRMAGPVRPNALHKYTPSIATIMATILAEVNFWVTSRQMKMAVMAKAAMGTGMSTAAPTAQPTMFEIVQELWENRFTMSARSTDQLPSAKRAVFTP